MQHLFIQSWITSNQLGCEHTCMTPNLHKLPHNHTENKLISKNQDFYRFNEKKKKNEDQTGGWYITKKVMHTWPCAEKMKVVL